MQPDGNKYSRKEHEELARTIAQVLRSPGGKRLLDYMKSISTHRVMPPNGGTEALWHLEGMRHIVFLLNYWMEEHDRIAKQHTPSQ